MLLALVIVLLSALTASGWLNLHEEEKNIRHEIETRGSDISRFVAKSLVYSVVGYDYHTIDLLLKEITLSEDVGYCEVVNRKGKTMASSGVLIENNPSQMVLFKRNLILNDDVVGVLTLGLSTEKINQDLQAKKYGLIKREALVIVFIALGEFIVLSFIIIKPVTLISKSLQTYKDNERNILGHIPITSNDEFGELAKKFNDLSTDLNSANTELQSRIEYANNQLIKTNNLLLERSKELTELNEEFKNLSITDSLTGLNNRRYFEDMLSTEIEVTKRHGDINSLLMIDIDHFKKINDKYGHTYGDLIIKMIADVMQKRLRDIDILCRIGGEEFVAICKRANKSEAIALAEDLRKRIEQRTTRIGSDRVKVTVSIGVMTVTAENSHVDMDSIFKYADMALYKSKHQGRNCVHHYDDIEENNQRMESIQS